MKKIIDCLTVFICVVVMVWMIFECAARADEIELGKVDLTKNQMNHLSDLQKNSDVIRSFSVIDGNVTVYTKRSINSSEKNLIVNDLKSLPDTPPDDVADKNEFKNNIFKGMTPQQAEDWIDANVTNLQDAKTALKKIVRVLIYLIRRSDLVQ